MKVIEGTLDDLHRIHTKSRDEKIDELLTLILVTGKAQETVYAERDGVQPHIERAASTKRNLERIGQLTRELLGDRELWHNGHLGTEGVE